MQQIDFKQKYLTFVKSNPSETASGSSIGEKFDVSSSPNNSGTTGATPGHIENEK